MVAGAFAIGFGVGYGCFAALIGALAADYFGTRHAGAIIGVLYTSLGPGSLLGPPLAGFTFELDNSYVLPISFGVAALVASVALTMAMPEPRRWLSGSLVYTPA